MNFLLFIYFIFQIPQFSATFLSQKSELNEYSQEYNALITWMTNNGAYVSPKFKPIENDIHNRYIITTEKIDKKEEILFVPNNICISYVHPIINPLCRPVGWYEEPDTLFDCLFYYFTIDQFNKKSFFAPYYNYLPSLDFNDFIMGFPKTPENQKLFTLTQLESEINSFEYHFSETKKRLQRLLPEQITDEQLAVNFLFVASRNFGRGGSRIFSELNNLVPYLDLFNHYNNKNTKYYYNDQRQGYVLFAARDIMPGEEVTVSYGQKSNRHLLGVYGFALENNQYKSSYTLSIRNEILFMSSYEKPKVKIMNLVNRKNNEINEEKKEILLELKNELKIRLDGLDEIGKNYTIKNIKIAIDEVREVYESYYKEVDNILNKWE